MWLQIALFNLKLWQDLYNFLELGLVPLYDKEKQLHPERQRVRQVEGLVLGAQCGDFTVKILLVWKCKLPNVTILLLQQFQLF